jgi:hypothetical protein
MDIRISIFDFLRIKHLTEVGDFSPSIDSGATIDHYNDLKSYFRVLNLIVESNVLSKTDLGIEICRFCVKVQLLSHQKTRLKSGIFSEKNENFFFNICILFD